MPIDTKIEVETALKQNIQVKTNILEEVVLKAALSAHFIKDEDLNDKISHSFLDEVFGEKYSNYYYWRNVNHMDINSLIDEEKIISPNTKKATISPRLLQIKSSHIAGHEYSHHLQKILYKNGELNNLPSTTIERQAIFFSGIFFGILNPDYSDDELDFIIKKEETWGNPDSMPIEIRTHGTGKERRTFFLDGLQAWKDTKNIKDQNLRIKVVLQKAFDIIPKHKPKAQDLLLKKIKRQKENA